MPEPKKKAKTVGEIYLLADEPPRPNSFTWILELYHLGYVSSDQMKELRRAASKRASSW